MNAADWLYVDTAPELEALVARLHGSPWLALDTEFIRERTYYPQLCLIQIATPELIACIDPLALPDIGPLLDMLFDPATLKVLHAATQDLEIFFHLRGAVPQPVFDTQIAASLLGHGEQVGYGTLVESLLGITLDKSQSRTDWARRPLDAVQLAYAADDVRHLRTTYALLCDELDRLGRRDWLDQDFADICRAQRYAPNPAEAWRRIKGARTLRGVQLAVLAKLAEWRESQAMASDRPRKWIAADELLLDLARVQPRDELQLGKLRTLEAATARRHGATLLTLITEARALPKESWPQLPPRRQLAAEQEALVDAMMAVVRLRGLQKGVSTAQLAARRELEQLIEGERDLPLLHGWRAGVAGREVLDLLEGRLALTVDDGELRTLERAAYR